MRVYKFLDKKWALVALRDRRLKIGTYDNLNDPFELLPFKTSAEIAQHSCRDADARRGQRRSDECMDVDASVGQ